MRPVTERALQILESTIELSMRPKSDDRQKLIAHVIREAVQQVLPDTLERKDHSPSGKFVGWKQELLKIADEVESL